MRGNPRISDDMNYHRRSGRVLDICAHRSLSALLIIKQRFIVLADGRSGASNHLICKCLLAEIVANFCLIN